MIATAKLRYCLDPLHPVGAHKARLFASALGLGPNDEKTLEIMLRGGIASHEARLRHTLIDGTERWVVEWQVVGRLGLLRMITAWDRTGRGEPPRLVSCYLKKVRP